MYEKLGSFVARRWILVIIAWILAAAALNPMVQRKVFNIHFTPTCDEVTKVGDLAYPPDRMTSVRGQQLYNEAFPENKSRADLVIVLERKEGLLPADLALARNEIADYFLKEKEAVAKITPPKSEEERIERDKRVQVVDILKPASTTDGTFGTGGADDLVGAKLISPEKKACLVVATLEHEFIAINSAWALGQSRKAITEIIANAEKRATNPLPPGLNLGITGSAAVGGDTLKASDESIQRIHVFTGVLVVIILLVVYRAPVVVFVPLLTIGVSVSIAKDLVALLTQLHSVPGFQWFSFEIFKTSEIFIFVILFGSGTDFCLFLISRYREEMEHGLDKKEALVESLGQVGEALTGSAFTTICGLGMMYFADFGKFTYSGPAIALCLFIALVACLTFAPALIRGCGPLVFWPFGVKIRPKTTDDAPPIDNTMMGRFWAWSIDRVIARPGLILLAALILMTPFALEGWNVRISYNLLADLPSDRTSVQGTKLLKEHFAAGETGPITMLVKQDGAHFSSDEGRDRITELTKELYQLSTKEITAVRSLTYPLGDPPKKRSARELFVKSTVEHHGAAESKYVSKSGPRADQVTRFDVIQVYDPFSPEAEQVLEKVRGLMDNKISDPQSPWYNATFDFIGTTAGTRDLKAVITSDEWLIQRLVVLAVFGVVLAIVRRPLICVYLILTVVFSYLATIGLTELAFAWAYGSEFTGLDWKVPIFLFVILVAVGEDYNIFLATRVFEEERRWGRIEGLRAAVTKTGGIITSCGIIMAGTFVSLMSGSLVAMLALGFALTLGVILDTFIVRPVLVPAFLAWLYQMTPEPQAATPPAPAVDSLPEEEALPAGALLTESVVVPGKPHTERARRAVNR